jgi:cell division protein FtsB
MASPPAAFRGPRSQIHWHRVGRVALLVVLGAIVLLYIGPVAHWIQQRDTAAHTRSEVHELQAEHERLKGRLKELTGPGAIERQARSMGMVKAGERSYVLEGR